MMKKIIVLALMVLFTWTAFAGTTNLDTLELSGDCTIAGSLSVVGNITASSGSVTVAGDLDVTGTITAAGSSIASPYIFTGAITLGEDGTGVDLLCYGDALSASMLWDYTADELIFDGAATAFFGDNNIVYLGDGDGDADRDFALYYDSNDLILLPKLAADGFKIGTNSLPVSITHNGTITVGASDEGHDVTFYGDTAATYMSWDESADDLIFSGAAAGLVIGDEAQLRFGGDASGDVVFNWDTSKFEMESNAAASTWNIGAVGKVFNTTHTGAFEVVGASTFDAITGVGNLSVDGTTAVLDGETSVRGVSAGFTSLEAPDIRFGVSDAIYTKFAVASPSGNLTITHVGGGTDLVTWTAAGGFNLVGAIALDAITAVGNFSVDGTTALVDGQTSVRGVSAGFTSLEAPDIRFGYDASDYMKIAVSTGTGNVAITHTGTNKSVTWTAAAGFDFVGAIALDAVTISGAVSVDDLTQSTDTITGSIHTDGGLGVAKDIFGGSDLDIVDSVTVGDLVIDEAEGVLSFTGATSATISTSTAGVGLILDAADMTAGTAQEYVKISGTTPAHAGGTPVDIFLDFDPTIGVNTAAADCHLIDMTFSSPTWGTAVASNLRGIYFAPTIADATLGTNAVALIDIAAISGDAQVSLYGLRFGALTGTAATENAIDIASGWDYGIECESKSRFGLAQGATGINMDGTDPDQAFQAHADITSDVASGAYATVYETMTLSNSTTNDTSIFGDWAELYVTGDLTLARGNLAGSWGHLELVDGGGGNLTLNAVSDAYPSYAGGVVGTVIAPDTLVVGAHRSLAAIVASGAIASGYSVNADGDFAGVLIRADDQPFPVGLLIDDDDATIDIQLSTDQYIDGSTAGVASVGGDSAVEYVAGCMRTVITVDSSSAGDDIDLEDKDDGGGTLLYTFPVGHIRILGAVADLTATSSAEIFQATFPMSLGTTAAADAEATLTGTEADICASTAISYDGAVACDLPPVSAADMTFDGTTSAVAVYLNAAVAAADINGAATVKCTGTVTIHWINLGDY